MQHLHKGQSLCDCFMGESRENLDPSSPPGKGVGKDQCAWSLSYSENTIQICPVTFHICCTSVKCKNVEAGSINVFQARNSLKCSTGMSALKAMYTLQHSDRLFLSYRL